MGHLHRAANGHLMANSDGHLVNDALCFLCLDCDFEQYDITFSGISCCTDCIPPPPNTLDLQITSCPSINGTFRVTRTGDNCVWEFEEEGSFGSMKRCTGDTDCAAGCVSGDFSYDQGRLRKLVRTKWELRHEYRAVGLRTRYLPFLHDQTSIYDFGDCGDFEADNDFSSCVGGLPNSIGGSGGIATVVGV